MRASFADESYYGRQWYRTTVLAHVKSSHDFSWIIQIESEARKLGFYGEVKASFALQIMKRLDSRSQKRIWHVIQKIPISIINPRYYLRKFGLRPMNEYCFQFEYKGKKFFINRADPFFQQFEKFIHQNIAEQILIDSPLPDIEIAIENVSESFDVFPSMRSFSPEKVLASYKAKDLKAQIMNVTELSLRLFSAFYELRDPDIRQEILDKISFYGMDFFWPISHFYRELLLQSVIHTRYFDEGHTKSVNFIRDLFSKVKSGLSHDIFGPQIIWPESKVEEVRSMADIRIRASDVIAGIARIIYDYYGVDGLRRRFKIVFINGKII